MENVISKELLSEVLGKSKHGNIKWVGQTNIFGKYKNILEYQRDNLTIEIEEINIHELSHKCKEWARNKHYIIVSALINNKDTARAKIKYSSKKDAFLDTETEYFNADTETEAIFKACQWIYEKTKDSKNGNS